MRSRYLLRLSLVLCLSAGLFTAGIQATGQEKRPNMVVISAGSLGFSDLGCYGSEISTPALDGLASQGLQFTQFYNCGASEMSLTAMLTGQYPHRVGMGYPMVDLKNYSYRASMNDATATLPEFLKKNGYVTMAVGKWSVTNHYKMNAPRFAWPGNRGIDRFYGTILTQSSYFEPENLMMNTSLFPREAGFYYTDAIGREAANFLKQAGKTEKPFFLYVSYTAPSWPLHASEADIKKQAGRYNGGWDITRTDRFARMKQLRVLTARTQASPQDPRVVAWNSLGSYRPWQARRMEVYAAQVAALDRSVGAVLEAVRQIGAEQNTIVIFFSDAGATADEISAAGMVRNPAVPQKQKRETPISVGNDPRVMPGGPLTFQSYGVPWANVSNTPFRGYAKTVYEGGIASPCLVCWPAGIRESGKVMVPTHVIDIFPTLVEVSQYVFPKELNGKNTLTPAGESWVPMFSLQERIRMAAETDRTERFLFWETEGNCAVRYGQWKLIWTRNAKQWELYNMILDRTERENVYARHQHEPDVKNMIAAYDKWMRDNGVKPWKNVQAMYKKVLQKQKEEELRRSGISPKTRDTGDDWEEPEE